MNRLSIRPKIKLGESLTSFLLRVCTLNTINIKDLFDHLKINYKYPDLRNAHQIDVIPSNTIDVKLLVKLTNIDLNFLYNNSFNGVITNFISIENMGTVNNSSTLIKDLFTVKKRKFCPECLKEDLIYMLLWQVKDISVCPKHNISLTSSCSLCQKEQPYLHMGLTKGICCFCGNSLTNIKEYIFNNELLTFNSWLMDQWNTLFKYNSNSSNINEKAIALKLLFITGNKKEKFDIKNIEVIRKDYKFKLINILANKSSENFGIGLRVLLQLLWKLNLSIIEFSSLEVPTEFKRSISDYLNKYSYIKCIVPWCNYRETNQKLFKMNSVRTKTHYRLHICLGCCVKFGVNKKNGTWEEYGDFIKIGYHTILQHVNNGESISSLSKITGLSRYKIYKITSYLARFELINKEHISNFIPKNSLTISTENLLMFTDRNESKMRVTVKKYLNIGIDNFYYFYYDPLVQENIFISNKIIDY